MLYPEYITDDARLTLENALSAAAHGAHVANHARVERILRDGRGAVVSASVRDESSEEVHRIAARCVVNAGGPWAQHILEESGLPVEKPIRPSKGSHILLSTVGGSASDPWRDLPQVHERRPRPIRRRSSRCR